MSNTNERPAVTAEFSGAGKLLATPGEARREIRADGSLWLIFADQPKPKKEIKASAADEIAIRDSDDCIAEGMLTDREQMELEEHEAVAVGPVVYAYWTTDTQGLRWLKRVDAIAAEAAELEHEVDAADDGLEAASNRRMQLYYGIVERRAAGQDIDAEMGCDILDLAGKSMDDFNADVAELCRLNMELGIDG